jgi:hypothetical protein
LLALGERLGSVKEERWVVKAEAEIEKIPLRIITESDVNDSDRYKHASKSNHANDSCVKFNT